MTDQGAATGQMPYEPGRCECGDLVTLHKPIEIAGVARRGPCSSSTCPCRRFVAAEAVRCVWCHRLGHAAESHPLPKSHPQYDAFYDASDEELAEILSTARRPGVTR